MNTVNSNFSTNQTNFKGHIVSPKTGKMSRNLVDAVDYANFVSKFPKRAGQPQNKTQKMVKQFFNTLKSIKNDKTDRELNLKEHWYKFQTPEHKNNYEYGYGNFQKTKFIKSRYPDSAKDTFKQVIEIGKNIFGEKKISKPISDLDKHEISKMAKNY